MPPKQINGMNAILQQQNQTINAVRNRLAIARANVAREMERIERLEQARIQAENEKKYMVIKSKAMQNRPAQPRTTRQRNEEVTDDTIYLQGEGKKKRKKTTKPKKK